MSNDVFGTGGLDNTTTTPLTGAATFTGEWENASRNYVVVSVEADVAGTLYFDFSNDHGTSTITSPVSGFAIPAGLHRRHVAFKFAQQFRVRFVNGSSAQATFSLYTYYTDSYPREAYSSFDSAMGNVPGVSGINKFGAQQVITADTETDVWDGGAAYTFPATALITKISQTTNQAALTGALVNVQGLDENWEQLTQIIALDASDTTTPVTLATPLIRCFRMILMGNTACTSTIRAHNDAENVDYAIITTGLNQTLMAIYTVPAGKTAYMTSYYCSNIDATNKTPTSTEVKLLAANRNHGDLFTVKHANAIPEAGPGFQMQFNPYYEFTEKTDIRINVVCADQDGHVHAGFDLYLVDQ